jgi:hypothetical protein
MSAGGSVEGAWVLIPLEVSRVVLPPGVWIKLAKEDVFALLTVKLGECVGVCH